MDKSREKIWFEGSNEIQCDLKLVENSLKNIGKHYSGIINLMPGMTSVQLIEKGSDYIVIKTNEGLMKRTNISKTVEVERILVEFNEEYQAGKMVTTKSHFLDEYKVSEDKINHRIVISELKAPGFMGFLYRNFGRSNMGKAFLKAHKSFLEKETGM